MIHAGASYYPEFWPEEKWAGDLRLMREIGLNAVRIAGFAWASIEPEPERFDTGWLTRFLALSQRHQIDVLLCAPTATPPKWLTHRYPGTRVVRPDGRPVDDYGRKYYCPLSAKYRDLTRRVIGEMVRVAAAFDHVIAWQIDNEMGPHEVGRCFCPGCAASFRQWLEAKYSTLDNLNSRWQTAHWSQRISAWEEIDLPSNRTQAAVSLDFCRFGQDAWTGYYDLQKETLRELGVRVPISTNFMCPIYEALDYWDFVKRTDIALVDHYIGGMAPAASGLALDLIRSLRKQPFWIAETGTAGRNGGEPSQSELRLWAWRAGRAGCSISGGAPFCPARRTATRRSSRMPAGRRRRWENCGHCAGSWNGSRNTSRGCRCRRRKWRSFSTGWRCSRARSRGNT